MVYSATDRANNVADNQTGRFIVLQIVSLCCRINHPSAKQGIPIVRKLRDKYIFALSNGNAKL